MTLERQKKATTSTVTSNATQSTDAGTLEVPEQKKDEPINSRNSPTTLNILTCSTDKDDFANR